MYMYIALCLYNIVYVSLITGGIHSTHCYVYAWIPPVQCCASVYLNDRNYMAGDTCANTV